MNVCDRVRIERNETLYPSRGTWPKYRGRIGTVVEVNGDEYGLIFGKVYQRPDGSYFGGKEPKTWFLGHELKAV